MAASLSGLRDALSAMGISTSTGELRGEARRLELVMRLQQAQASNPHALAHANISKTLVSSLQHAGAGDTFSSHIDSYQHMALGELRKVLEERGQSTQTPGLKGEARRHALVQRLVNTHGQMQQPTTSTQPRESSELLFGLTNRESVSDSGDDDNTDTKSVSSSSSYSAASEFLFFDFPSGRDAVGDDTSHDVGCTDIKQFQQEQYSNCSTVPALDLKRGTNKIRSNERAGKKDNQSSFVSVSAGEMDQSPTSGEDQQLQRSVLHDELFETRKQLHQLRGQRQRSIEKCMQDAGFGVNLNALSLQLETLEKERQRLRGNYFAHELVTSSVLARLSSYSAAAQPVELVQEDAIQLLEKVQEKLRKQVKQTKEALEIIRNALEADNNNNSDSSTSTPCDTEAQLTTRIQQISEFLYQQTIDSGMPSWRSVGSSSSAASSSSSMSSCSDPSLPVLTRCQSMPSATFKETWKDLEPEQKQQLCYDLRSAVSFRIKRDRISLGGQLGSRTTRTQPVGLSENTAAYSSPSQADRLGIKALFLEQTQRSVLETSRTYQQAVALDRDHAINLGNYARFLYLVCGNLDLAQEHFQLAIQSDPLNAQNLVNYANFLKRARHNLDQAEKYYQQALRLAPNDVNVMGNYANLLIKKGGGSSEAKHRMVRAKELLELALRLAPGHIQNRLQYATVLAAVGDLSSAERCYEQLVSTIEQQKSRAVSNQESSAKPNADKQHAHVYGNYANFLLNQRQWEQAKLMYSKALALLPRHPLLLRNLYVGVCWSIDDDFDTHYGLTACLVLAAVVEQLEVSQREQAAFHSQVINSKRRRAEQVKNFDRGFREHTRLGNGCMDGHHCNSLVANHQCKYKLKIIEALLKIYNPTYTLHRIASSSTVDPFSGVIARTGTSGFSLSKIGIGLVWHDGNAGTEVQMLTERQMLAVRES